MALFGIGKIKTYLGVDIGTAGIKMVQLRESGGRAKLHTYAYTLRGPDEIGTKLMTTRGEEADQSDDEESEGDGDQSGTGLPLSSVFSSVVSVPRLGDKEQKGAIEIQARKLISMPLEELILDYKVITPPELLKAKGPDAIKNIQVLLTAAPKTLVSKYLAIFRAAGLELASLETEAFALIRALVGKDRSTLMIVDIGSLRTSTLVVVGGIPYLSRSIDIGAAKFTKAAAEVLGVPEKQAESMKNDFRTPGSGEPGGVPPVFSALIDQIAAEINFSLKLFSGLDIQTSTEKGASRASRPWKR